MKPCSTRRKQITWLALEALESRQAALLREHLDGCVGCRRYLEELSRVAGKVLAVDPEIEVEATGSFHRRVVGALRAAKPPSIWVTIARGLRSDGWKWRLAVPAACAIALAIAGLFFLVNRPGPGQTSAGIRTLMAEPGNLEFEPTLSNYRMVASQSLDSLDELLTRQGNRNPSPGASYSASSFGQASAAD